MQTIRTAAATAAALLAFGGVAAGAAPARPSVTIHTEPGAVLVGLPAGGGRAEGAVAAPAGTSRVRVIWCGNAERYEGGGWSCGSGPLGSIAGFDATLGCTSSARTACEWSAPAPVRPGRYLLFAIATDKLKRTGAAGPVEVLVV